MSPLKHQLAVGPIPAGQDLQAFEERASEPDLLFETVVRALKADGKI